MTSMSECGPRDRNMSEWGDEHPAKKKKNTNGTRVLTYSHQHIRQSIHMQQIERAELAAPSKRTRWSDLCCILILPGGDNIPWCGLP